jgi:hypothetical protein
VTPRWLRRLLGAAPPEGFEGRLATDERVLGSAPVGGGGHVVVTTFGLWVPDDQPEDRPEDRPDHERHRRIGWHLVSKAAWDGRALTVIEADEIGQDGDAILIADREPSRFALPEPASVPELVHARVTRSILHSERNPAGDTVVHRRIPGRDGAQLQVRRAEP